MNVTFPIFANRPFFDYSITAGGALLHLSFAWSSVNGGFSVTMSSNGAVFASSVPINPWVNLFHGTNYETDNQLWLVGEPPTLENFGVANELVYGQGAVIG